MVRPIVAIILMVGITVVLASVLYTPSPGVPMDDRQEVRFPSIEVRIIDNSSGDKMIIKHLFGEPIDWTKYKVIITNNTDESSTTLTQLSTLGGQSVGERSGLNRSIHGFNGINYQKDNTYQIEIYNLKENRRVFSQDVVCE